MNQKWSGLYRSFPLLVAGPLKKDFLRLPLVVNLHLPVCSSKAEESSGPLTTFDFS